MTHLREGDTAPNFTAKNQMGKTISLSDYKGKKIVLFFYPKDNTPGCTAEACSLRDYYKDLKKAGFEVIGVSKDTEKSHKKFIADHDLPYSLIADADLKVNLRYGVWGEKTFMGKTHMGTFRTTFLISETGKIEKIFTKVNTKEHAQEILENYKAIPKTKRKIEK